jgi:hypothetical protein
MAFDLGAMTGAVVGAGATAGFSVWAARRSELERERRRMIAAMGRVLGEINENANRPGVLTLGDWEASKEVLSTLGLRTSTRPLWLELSDVYRRVYEARSGMTGIDGQPVERPTSEELTVLAQQLEAERIALDRRAVWPASWFNRG